MKTLSSLVAVAAFGLSASAFAQSSATCAPTDERQIAGLFDRWNSSLRTLDADKVTANYAADGVLLPTIANQPRTTPAQIHDYFVKFLKNEPQGKIDTRFIKIGCNVAQDVGTYTFTLKGNQQVQARYTYVYEFKNGQWLISHHHSSMMPESALEKVASK